MKVLKKKNKKVINFKTDRRTFCLIKVIYAIQRDAPCFIDY